MKAPLCRDSVATDYKEIKKKNLMTTKTESILLYFHMYNTFVVTQVVFYQSTIDHTDT